MHAAQHPQRQGAAARIGQMTVEDGRGGTAGQQVIGGVPEQPRVERAAQRFAMRRLGSEHSCGSLYRALRDTGIILSDSDILEVLDAAPRPARDHGSLSAWTVDSLP